MKPLIFRYVFCVLCNVYVCCVCVYACACACVNLCVCMHVCVLRVHVYDYSIMPGLLVCIYVGHGPYLCWIVPSRGVGLF